VRELGASACFHGMTGVDDARILIHCEEVLVLQRRISAHSVQL
jgi:hypothetical protein